MAYKIVLSEEQLLRQLSDDCKNFNVDLSETDGQGQVVIYTGYFRQSDGNYSNVQDPTYSDDPTDA